MKSTLSSAKSSVIVGKSSHHKQNTGAQKEENCLRQEYICSMQSGNLAQSADCAATVSMNYMHVYALER